MPSPLRSVQSALRLLGLDLRLFWAALAGCPYFLKTLALYWSSEQNSGFPLRASSIRPILSDRFEQAGTITGHYFYQDLWAARKIFANRPSRHLDVGSRVDGFVAHLLAFMPVEVVDLRPLDSQVEGLTFVCEDATTLARFASDSVQSLSSLHAVEHFGLGRYGDRIDPDACFLAMKGLARVLSPGGRLYFSVPIGRQRLEFNAQRVFAPATVLAVFQELQLLSFAAVDDGGRFHEVAQPRDFVSARNACGLFEFTK